MIALNYTRPYLTPLRLTEQDCILQGYPLSLILQEKKEAGFESSYSSHRSLYY